MRLPRSHSSLAMTRETNPSLRGVRRTTKQSPTGNQSVIARAHSARGNPLHGTHTVAAPSYRLRLPRSHSSLAMTRGNQLSLRGVRRTTKQSPTGNQPSLRGVRRTTKRSPAWNTYSHCTVLSAEIATRLRRSQ